MTTPLLRRRPQGASLLITLIIIAAIVVLMTIMARLVSVEKRVSSGYTNILRAELAAQAGAADAGDLLLELFQKYPDSVTYWDRKLGATDTPGTVFMYRDLAPNEEYAGVNGAAKVYARPLISGAVTKDFYPVNDYPTTLPATAVAVEESIDINEPKRFGDQAEKGWIGAPPGATTLPGKSNLEIRVPWVEIKDADGQVVSRYAYWVEDESFKLNVNQTDERLRGDLASEVDAESGNYEPKASLRGVFEPMVSTSLHEARGKLTATNGRMLSPLQIGHTEVLPGEMTAEEFGREYRYLLTTESSGLDLSRTGARRMNLNEVVRRAMDEIPQTEHVGGANPVMGHDLSAKDGDGEVIAAREIGKGIQRMESAINHNAPRFGQRYYRLNSTNQLVSTTAGNMAQKNDTAVTTTRAEEYVRKISTNVFDYISPVANPTVFVNDQVDVGMRVNSLGDYGVDMSVLPADNTPNPIQVMGKKNVLYPTEHAMHTKIISATKPGTRGGVCDYVIKFDHYIELTNLGNLKIDLATGSLGPKPYLIMENQPSVSVRNGNGPPREDIPFGRPFKIKLDDEFIINGNREKISVLPGESIVITTDPQFKTTPAYDPLTLAGKKVYIATALYAPSNDPEVEDVRSDSGISSPPYPQANSESAGVGYTSTMTNIRMFNCTSFDTRSGNDNGEIQIGYDSTGINAMKILVGNQYGLLAGHPSITLTRLWPNNLIVYKPVDGMNGNQREHYVVSYVGGSSRKGAADPRASLEAMSIRPGGAEYSGTLPATGTTKNLGTVAEGGDLGNKLWETDNVGLNSTANPWTVVAAGPMRSIGELGNIFDPIRYGKSSISEMQLVRGGGRTLTIGQPDMVWDGTRVPTALADSEMKFQTSPSRAWAAWRLADVFTLRKETKMRGHPDAKVEVEGLYNINGILRDDGKVLKALLEGLTFGDAMSSDLLVEGHLFATSKADELLPENQVVGSIDTRVTAGAHALANYMAQRLYRSIPKRFSPLWEVGELSQLDIFKPQTRKLLDASANTSEINDRSREEIFGRLADLLTVKGNTFSIYVVGQSMNKLGKVTSTKAQRVTVRLRPIFESTLPEDEDENENEEEEKKDDFDPNDPVQVHERFRKPDAYTLEVVNTEDA